MKHPKVNIKLTHKLNSYPVEAPSTATFGDLKVGFQKHKLQIPSSVCGCYGHLEVSTFSEA